MQLRYKAQVSENQKRQGFHCTLARPCCGPQNQRQSSAGFEKPKQIPSPFPISMAPPLSTSLAWAWVLEALSNIKEADTGLLHALMNAVPDLSSSLNACKTARERVSLRYLEEWMVSNSTNASSDASDINISMDFGSDVDALDVLNEIVTSSDLGKCGAELKEGLSQFILRKRAALPKYVIQKLKDSVIEECRLSAPSMKKRISADNSNENDTAKRLKFSTTNDEIQQLEQNSTATALENGKEVLQDPPELPLNGDLETTHQVAPQNICVDQAKDGGENGVLPESGENGVLPETPSSRDGGHDTSHNDETFAAKKHMFLSSQGPVTHDSLAADWTEQKFCVKCEEGGELLICSGNSCPVTVHESCLGSSVSFEDDGNFYCPFCLYTRAHAAYRKAKQKASLARKALSAFMGGDTVHRNRQKQPPEKVSTKPKESRTMGANCPDRIHADQQHRDIIDNHHCVRVAESHHTTKAAVDCNDANVSCREVEASLTGEVDGVSITKGNAEMAVGHQGVSGVKHQKQTETVTDCNVRNSPSREAESSPISEKRTRGRRKGAPRLHIFDQADPSLPNIDAEETTRNQNGEDLSSDKPPKRRRPAKRYTNPAFPYARRTKLRWTKEEEEALKEAVHRYSRSGDKNIPWTMILESGHHVFHKTRTQVDLKDKWRNITRKQSTKDRSGT
ncbi:uncharacterized protein LOC131248466 isoform X2 [Magnolia sinica]|uniref:uncharacterized protein LOC131248466 isoform X2 n=1 Tax=Magnolia sinica TaxID=86752 RepID=UPI00265AF01F|nr:uncharacterized protein LOC131248466 isoform X2 [Magnolia sinica]